MLTVGEMDASETLANVTIAEQSNTFNEDGSIPNFFENEEMCWKAMNRLHVDIQVLQGTVGRSKELGWSAMVFASDGNIYVTPMRNSKQQALAESLFFLTDHSRLIDI